MYAYRINEWQQQPEFVETEKPTPRSNQILIKVAGNGLCHSDFHMAHIPEAIGSLIGWKVPFTLGHEVGGWIEDWGPEIDPRKLSVERGAPVALVSPRSCGRCLECEAGFDNICDLGRAGRGYGLDGGLAEYMLIESPRSLIPLENLDPVTAGPLTDAGSTSYHAFNRARPKLVKGSTALVIGAGGLGSFAVQYIKLLTEAELIVADTNPVALARAKEYGANVCIQSTDADLPAEVQKLTSGRGVIAVLDFVGVDATIEQSISCLAKRGTYVLVGAAGGGHAGALYQAMAPKAAELYSFQGPTIADTKAVLSLAEQGELDNRVELFPFEEKAIRAAYEKLDKGGLTGRAVIEI